jgi:hypothetical protein
VEFSFELVALLQIRPTMMPHFRRGFHRETLLFLIEPIACLSYWLVGKIEAARLPGFEAFVHWKTKGSLEVLDEIVQRVRGRAGQGTVSKAPRIVPT